MNEMRDDELEGWRRAWRGAAAARPLDPARLARRVRRRSRGLALLTVGETVFALSMISWLARLALRLTDPVSTATLVAFCLLTGGLLGYALWSRHGVWRPADQSPEAFLALSIERCRRRLRSLAVAGWVLLLEVGMLVLWIELGVVGAGGSAPGSRRLAYGALAVLTVTVGSVLWVMVPRTRRELAELEELAASLGDS